MANTTTVAVNFAEKHNLDLHTAKKMVGSVLDSLWEVLKTESIVKLRGRCTLELYVREARSITLPKSKKPLHVPETIALKISSDPLKRYYQTPDGNMNLRACQLRKIIEDRNKTNEKLI